MKNINRIQNLDAVKKSENQKINFTKTQIASKIENILNLKNNNENFENTDLKRELMLAEIFGLTEDKKAKLKKDYSEIINVNDILIWAESYWNHQKAVNDTNLRVAA